MPRVDVILNLIVTSDGQRTAFHDWWTKSGSNKAGAHKHQQSNSQFNLTFNDIEFDEVDYTSGSRSSRNLRHFND